MENSNTGTQSNIKAEVFYFKCPTLEATLNNVTCERARTEKAKDASASVRKCLKCTEFEQHQAIDPIPASVYHAGIGPAVEKPSGSAYRQHWRHVGKN